MDKDARIAELERSIRGLQDRQDIYDCLVRYCRGIDRNDPELVASAYHPDALDDHGAYCGGVDEVTSLSLAFHNENHKRTQHSISNHYCEIEGDVAHCETYFMYTGFNKNAPPDFSLLGGRYLDRFERRNGRWAIALRQSIIEWYGTPGEAQAPTGGMEVFNAAFPPTRDKSDPSYKRPFQIDPARVGYGHPEWRK